MAKVDNREAQLKQTTVEEGTEFRGTLHSRCQVVVRGVVDGDLVAPSLVVSDTGTVVGNVKAESIRSEGVVAGHLDADDVYLSGSVRSDTVIRAKTLEVKLRRERDKLEVTFGACVLEVGDDPTKEAEDAAKPQARVEAAQPSAEEREPAKEREPASASTRPRRRTLPPPADAELASGESANGRTADESGGRDRPSVPPPS